MGKAQTMQQNEASGDHAPPVTPYWSSRDGHHVLYHGDCLEVLPTLTDVDAVVTDPPYGLKFMGNEWDHGVPGVPFWEAALRVLKPGGHLLAFGGTRTFHRLACAIEDAGFEIRDTIMWVYGSGFPKSLDVSKAIVKAMGAGPQPLTAQQWDGWGTALKPAHEPIVVARKPLVGKVAANVLQHGTGAMNIDACRIATGETFAKREHKGKVYDGVAAGYQRPNKSSYTHKTDWHMPSLGRWPANVIHDGSEEAVSVFPQTGPSRKGKPREGQNGDGWGMTATGAEYEDSGSAARFFYCAKASRAERNRGVTKNNHPTVKPLALMRYLCRLVTPPGGIVLDCFAGSGSTLIAARDERFRYIGIE
ncbi:MAG TPA: site-specific DNA-methyltransferase, partial [Spirochaetia bacterium]|nr:site-specific DNA-methyltransferase [Spirochaetia bacterium]